MFMFTLNISNTYNNYITNKLSTTNVLLETTFFLVKGVKFRVKSFFYIQFVLYSTF